MLNAVNNLVYNLLVADGRVVLPTVGTLRIVVQSATMSKGKIAPPRRVVEYSSATEGATIVDTIVAIASVDDVAAQDIYSRWLDKVRTERGLTIEGVGKLVDKSFTPTPALNAALNPTAGATLKIRRLHHIWRRCALFMVAVLAAAAGCFYVVHVDVVDADDIVDINVDADLSAAKKSSINTEMQQIDIPAVTDDESIIEQPKNVAVEQLVEVKEDVAPRMWYESDDIRHWVVVGSYSTEQNAKRALRDIESKNQDVACHIFKLGSMYAVAAYGSRDREECEAFVRQYRKTFSQAWIHTPKRFK